MQQLSASDARFLYMESPSTFGHMSFVLIFDRPTKTFQPFEHVYQTFATTLGELPPLRRRLVEVPLALDHPYWIDDPAFDLSYHVRSLSLATPGLADQLAEQVSRLHGRALDRSRPLWEAYVIDGLGDNRWALLLKYHHAMMDPSYGQMLLDMITTDDPKDEQIGESAPWSGEEPPMPLRLMQIALNKMMIRPGKVLAVQGRWYKTIARQLGLNPTTRSLSVPRSMVPGRTERPLAALRQRGGRAASAMPDTPAPTAPWNRTITPHRRFAMRSASLANIKALKDATEDATVNDIILAVCAGGLRTYLERKGMLPADPLRAVVPLSIDNEGGLDIWTQQVRTIIADLPTDEPDPLKRLAKCQAAMGEAKRQWTVVPAETLIDATQTNANVLAASAARLSSQLHIEDYAAPPVNLTIANVPGPSQPVYFHGSKLAHQFPLPMITDNQGLAVTIISYMENLDFALVGDRDSVPDLWDLADDLYNEIAVLVEATGAKWAVPPRKHYPRYSDSRSWEPEAVAGAEEASPSVGA